MSIVQVLRGEFVYSNWELATQARLLAKGIDKLVYVSMDWAGPVRLISCGGVCVRVPYAAIIVGIEYVSIMNMKTF